MLELFNVVIAAVDDTGHDQVEIALITAVSGIVLALIGIFGARRFTHPSTPTTDPDEKRSKSESLLSSYTGEQNEFMSMVIKDSKTVHERLDAQDEVITLLRKERSQFIAAMGRYINKLVRAWGSGGTMPYPDTEDMQILEETLPADWRRRPK